MRWLAVLLVSALFAGCVASEEPSEDGTAESESDPLEFPVISVDVVDENEETSYTSVNGSKLFFVPTLVSGSLDDVDLIAMISNEGDVGFGAVLLEEGELVSAEVNLGVPGAHYWGLTMRLNDGNWSNGEKWGGLHPPDEAPAFWIATAPDLEPKTWNFTSGPLPDEEPQCGGPEDNVLLPADTRWGSAQYDFGSLYDGWFRSGDSVPLPEATITFELSLTGDAVPLLCDPDGNATEPGFQEVSDGIWTRSFGREELRPGGFGGLHGDVHFEVFSQRADNQVTAAPRAIFPAGPV